MYRPKIPFIAKAEILNAVKTEKIGVVTKEFESVGTISCAFRTFGGTEQNSNDLYSVIDTAQVETWYNPLITAASRIKILNTGKVYEVIGEPENIELRNQFMRFKVRSVSSGA